MHQGVARETSKEAIVAFDFYPTFSLRQLLNILLITREEEILNLRDKELYKVNCSDSLLKDFVGKTTNILEETCPVIDTQFNKLRGFILDLISDMKGDANSVIAKCVTGFFQKTDILNVWDLQTGVCKFILLEELRALLLDAENNQLAIQLSFKNFLGQLQRKGYRDIVVVIHLFIQLAKKIAHLQSELPESERTYTSDPLHYAATFIAPCIVGGLKLDGFLHQYSLREIKELPDESILRKNEVVAALKLSEVVLQIPEFDLAIEDVNYGEYGQDGFYKKIEELRLFNHSASFPLFMTDVYALLKLQQQNAKEKQTQKEERGKLAFLPGFKHLTLSRHPKSKHSEQNKSVDEDSKQEHEKEDGERKRKDSYEKRSGNSPRKKSTEEVVKKKKPPEKYSRENLKAASSETDLHIPPKKEYFGRSASGGSEIRFQGSSSCSQTLLPSQTSRGPETPRSNKSITPRTQVTKRKDK